MGVSLHEVGIPIDNKTRDLVYGVLAEFIVNEDGLDILTADGNLILGYGNIGLVEDLLDFLLEILKTLFDLIFLFGKSGERVEEIADLSFGLTVCSADKSPKFGVLCILRESGEIETVRAVAEE